MARHTRLLCLGNSKLGSLEGCIKLSPYLHRIWPITICLNLYSFNAINNVYIKLRRSHDLLWVLSFGSFSSFSSPIYARLLRYADKVIVNIMKVHIERNSLQLELIRYHTNCWLYSRLLLWSDKFNAISPTECISGSFEHKPLRSLSFINQTKQETGKQSWIQGVPPRHDLVTNVTCPQPGFTTPRRQFVTLNRLRGG